MTDNNYESQLLSNIRNVIDDYDNENIHDEAVALEQLIDWISELDSRASEHNKIPPEWQNN